MTVIRERFGIADAVIILAVVLLSASIIYPFWNIFSVSISNPEAIARGDVTLFPIDPRLDVYSAVLSNPRIYRAYFNTILYTVTSAGLTLLIGSLTAYPLALAGFQGRKYVTILLVVSLFVMPGLIPTYLLIISLGLRDTMWSFVLPAAFNVWYIVIIRTNFQAIPDALLESARLDGANDLTVLSRIVLPVSKAILATIGMFAAVHMWGLFFEPMLYLVDERKLPLSIVLRNVLVKDTVGLLFGSHGGEREFFDSAWLGDSSLRGLIIAIKMATIIVTIGPIMLVYPFAQRYFLQGPLIGSIKG